MRTQGTGHEDIQQDTQVLLSDHNLDTQASLVLQAFCYQDDHACQGHPCSGLGSSCVVAAVVEVVAAVVATEHCYLGSLLVDLG